MGGKKMVLFILGKRWMKDWCDKKLSHKEPELALYKNLADPILCKILSPINYKYQNAILLKLARLKKKKHLTITMKH